MQDVVLEKIMRNYIVSVFIDAIPDLVKINIQNLNTLLINTQDIDVIMRIKRYILLMLSQYFPSKKTLIIKDTRSGKDIPPERILQFRDTEWKNIYHNTLHKILENHLPSDFNVTKEQISLLHRDIKTIAIDDIAGKLVAIASLKKLTLIQVKSILK
jgi:hypothetical protein